MPEVHTGSRPGRPTALLIASALILAGAIGLAAWQVRARRALGPEVAIRGTPLLVRLPADWRPDPRSPNAFVLPTRGAPAGPERTEFERRISFLYEHAPAFVPPLELLSGLSGVAQAQPAHIGPFAAVQVRQIERRRWGVGQSILRLAVLPNGDRISVIYLPMTDLTAADLELLDSICDAVRVVDAGLNITAADAARQAAVELAFDAEWQAALPQISAAPGFFVAGQSRGVPAWSLGVFRTWLATGRAPADLLRDFAARVWLLPEIKTQEPDWKRSDGATVVGVRHPEPGRRPIVAAWVVAQSPSEALIMFLYCGADSVGPASTAAERIAQAVKILPLASIGDIAAAEEAGRGFAAKLASAGAVPWWGELPVRLRYRGTTPRGDELRNMTREPIGRNPVRGYRGEVVATIGKRFDETTKWEAGKSGSYDFSTQIYISEGQAIQVHEQRSARDEAVQRVVVLNDVKQPRRSFKPGAGFICPPLEGLVESWVARESPAACINEFSTLLGSGTHTRLLRPVPAENGYRCVLVQLDYLPFGDIVGFDENGEMQFERSASSEYRRVSDRKS